MSLATIDTTTGEVLKETSRNKENQDFVMLYRHYINQIADIGLQDAKALTVLLFLVRNMDGKNSLIISMKMLSEMLDMSRQTLSKKIKFLQDNGWIQVFKVGTANAYVINPDVVWTSYADQKKYCKFEATVMLDYSDSWDINNKDKQNIKHIQEDILKKIIEVVE